MDLKTERQIDRSHIVWALFPPLYWIACAGMGLLLSTIFLGATETRGIVGVYALGIGCTIGGAFAGPIFRRVCGHFEDRPTK